MTPRSKTKAKTAPSAASVLVVVAPTAVIPLQSGLHLLFFSRATSRSPTSRLLTLKGS